MAARESAAESEVSSALEQLRSSFFPILIGLMGPSPDSAEPDRVVLVNPVTQGMIILRGDAAMVSEILAAGGGGGGAVGGGAPPASKASIEAMRSVDSSELGGSEEGEEECSVCLEGLKRNKKEAEEEAAEVVKEMPCGHRFHGDCIEKWLRTRGSCPMCRFQMPAEEKEGGKKEDGEREEEGGEERRREMWVTITFGRRRDGDDEQQTAAAAAASSGEGNEGGDDQQIEG